MKRLIPIFVLILVAQSALSFPVNGEEPELRGIFDSILASSRPVLEGLFSAGHGMFSTAVNSGANFINALGSAASSPPGVNSQQPLMVQQDDQPFMMVHHDHPQTMVQPDDKTASIQENQLLDILDALNDAMNLEQPNAVTESIGDDEEVESDEAVDAPVYLVLLT